MKSMKLLGKIALMVLSTTQLVNAHGGRVIVKMRPGFNSGDLTTQFPIRQLDTTAPMPFTLFTVLPGHTAEEVEVMLRQSPAVAWAEDDGEMDDPDSPDNLAGGQGAGRGSTIGAVFDPNGLRVRNTNLIEQIAYAPLKYERSDRKVKVAILDTGLSPKQPHLWRSVVAIKDCTNFRGSGYDFPSMTDSNHNGLVDEAVSHGTMIAGLVNQFAPYSSLIIAKVADSDGSTTAWNLIKGYAFAVQNGAEVISVSMGSLNDIPALSDVLEWAEGYKAVTVAAAGNNNLQELIYPAEYSHAISVTGVNALDVKAEYSCYDNHARASAPSDGIYSTWWDGTMGVWSGTSFGTPIVAAAIADGLRKTRHPVTTDSVRFVARTYGDNIDPFNPNYEGELGRRINFNLLRPAIEALAP